MNLNATDKIFDLEKRSWSAVINQTITYLFFTMITVLLAWQCLAPPFLSYPKLPFLVLQSSYQPGEPVTLQVYRCNSSKISRSYVTTRELVNLETSELTILPATTVTVLPGCSWSYSKINIIPTDQPPGHYKFQGNVQINDFMVIRLVSWESQPFEVESTLTIKEP
jgi:hypothetical protein